MFDERRAKRKGPDYFPRLRLQDTTVLPLAEAPVRDDDYVQVVRAGGEALAFRVKDMAWHHVAVGELGGEPFALSLCIVCHMGVTLVPRHDGRALGLSCGGLSDGMAILIDDETQTYWHHVTGAALSGPLVGARLETRMAPLLSKREALAQDATLRVACAATLIARVVGGPMSRFAVHGGLPMPPHFKGTLDAPDARLAPMTNGLGVFERERAVFFPLARTAPAPSEHAFGARRVRIERGASGTPRATLDDGAVPDQLFGRWYGFSASFPECAVGPHV